MEDTIHVLQPCKNLEATVGETEGSIQDGPQEAQDAMTANIAQRNDALRRSIPVIFSPNQFVLTRGIADTFENKLEDLFERIRTFDAFTPDNDPWEEHDFGPFEFCGQKVFWKIDDYDGEQGLQLVFTILLADEY